MANGFPSNLRICLVPLADIINLKYFDDGKFQPYRGIEFNFLNILLETLQIKPTYVLPNPLSFGKRLENGSWNGAMGMLQRNECDICLSLLMLREDRTEAAGYTMPYFFEEVKFAARQPVLASKRYVLIDPFLPSLWYTIVTILFTLPLIFMLVNKNKVPYLDYLTKLLADLTEQTAKPERDLVFRERILLAFWSIGARLISFAYVSVLLSIMLVPSYEPAIDTIDKLVRAVESGHYDCAVAQESVYLHILQTSKDERLRRLADMMMKSKQQFSANNALSKAAIDKFAVILPLTYIKVLADPRVLISKEAVFTAQLSIYTSKTFCCTRLLNKFISRVLASGLYLYNMNQYTFQNRKFKIVTQPVIKGDEIIMKLSFEHLYGAFIIFIIGVTLSLLLFGGEIIYEKYQKQKINY